MSAHVALLGDSVFDNGAYTNGAPDVTTHLRRILPTDWTVTLLAVDGHMTSDLEEQLDRLPPDVTHLVISMGGNDALQNADVLDRPVTSTGRALDLFFRRQADFAASYSQAIDTALQRGLPTTVCTIYNGLFKDDQARRIRVALAMFNDVILRAAFARCLPVIDLGLLLTSPEDYANPIEPSGVGGEKIARLIRTSLIPEGHPGLHTRVLGRLPD